MLSLETYYRLASLGTFRIRLALFLTSLRTSTSAYGMLLTLPSYRGSIIQRLRCCSRTRRHGQGVYCLIFVIYSVQHRYIQSPEGTQRYCWSHHLHTRPCHEELPDPYRSRQLAIRLSVCGTLFGHSGRCRRGLQQLTHSHRPDV